METKEFKKMFGEIAVENGFEKAYEGWFKEFPEIIQVLELQKSNFGNYYYLNFKIFIQGAFGNKYIKSKQLVKNIDGEISFREPISFSPLLDLDNTLDEVKRKVGINKMFIDFINPLCNNTISKKKIIELYSTGNLSILSPVKKQLGIE